MGPGTVTSKVADSVPPEARSKVWVVDVPVTTVPVGSTRATVSWSPAWSAPPVFITVTGTGTVEPGVTGVGTTGVESVTRGSDPGRDRLTSPMGWFVGPRTVAV